MRNYARRRPVRRPQSSGSHWLTFSDLMSALVLIFVLVMFYAIYQYTDTTFELLSQQAILDEQSAALSSRETELEDKNQQLAQASTDLADSEERLRIEQARMLLANSQLETAEELLAAREAELNDAMTQLTDQQALLDAQRTQLEGQQSLLTEQQELMAAQRDQLEALVGVRARIVSTLSQAFADAQVDVDVDDTGALLIEDKVMFDFGSSALMDSGKALLDQLVPVYISIVFNEENKDYVSEILIEGHTDDVGSYTSNLKLSNERARAVMDYIMSPENTSISQEMKEQLSEKVTVAGRSYIDPVTDAYGNIDADASRRVEFKFRMQDAEAIEGVRRLLEGMTADSGAVQAEVEQVDPPQSDEPPAEDPAQESIPADGTQPADPQADGQ